MKKIILETGADAVKLEGGENFFNIYFSYEKKINVMGHLGLLPQKHNGKYPIYGRKNEEKNNERPQFFRKLVFSQW